MPRFNPRFKSCTRLMLLICLITGCATTAQNTHPDDALIAAIRQKDCQALWHLMTDDVRHHFHDTDVFCAYYNANQSMFETWARRIHDRLVADDVTQYAYLPNDPQGAVRMRKINGEWQFDTPFIAANIYDAERIRERFSQYLRSREFINDLRTYLADTNATSSEILKLQNALDHADQPMSIRFEGPFAYVQHAEPYLEIIFFYRKPVGTHMGAWEIYRCLF